MTSAREVAWSEALDWVRRIHDPTFTDWEAHVAWLEADPRHAALFDEASLLIEQGTAHLAPRSSPQRIASHGSATNDNDNEEDRPRATRRRWRWGAGLGGAVAAGIVAAIALPALIGSHPQFYRIETAPGTTRAIMLADGSRIALNGDSSVQLDRADSRTATVERGEAFFSIVHDVAHPFALQAGGARFQDIGTAFDVIRSPQGTQVAVREGALMYDPGGAAVRLDRGEAITVGDAVSGSKAVIRRIDAEAVGLWQQGRLSYRQAPLAQVADDLSRCLGQPVTIDPELAHRQFTGVIILAADRALMLRRIAAVMNVSIRQDGARVRILPPAR
ncbi:FecR family protein [Sphingomonas abietis]|uniref:FecR domain-containing protein n=1 Tax=Sphingomonas abietis TaxID=3012344 RepID=A0ABY7NN14_9SPHN|nr:FecR domain-containing protein [Sphingomonas abietis]WBO21299.1 FecR domain-containing protein [Sphingomonas abietis]